MVSITTGGGSVAVQAPEGHRYWSIGIRTQHIYVGINTGGVGQISNMSFSSGADPI